MVTPWSTNAVEITQNMGFLESFELKNSIKASDDSFDFDPMLSQKYTELNQDIFTIHIQPKRFWTLTILRLQQIRGLVLSPDEVEYWIIWQPN